MRILVTGAAGMLGTDLCPIFKEKGHYLMETDINCQEKRIKYLDVRDSRAVFKTVKKYNFDLVIHLAAETDLEVCEQDPNHAYLTNTVGTQNAALACQAYSIPMVHVSTAGVFDGEKNEPYTEFDMPNPINVYGASKYQSEKIVEKLLNRYYIVRAGWMIGGADKDKKFVAKIIKQIKEGKKKLFVVDDKFGTPTYTVDFSNCLSNLIKTGFYGLYHMVCEGEGTRFNVAKEILRFLKKEKIKVKPVNSDYFAKEFFAPRAKSEVMINYMLELRGLNTMRPWKVALNEYLKKNYEKIGNYYLKK